MSPALTKINLFQSTLVVATEDHMGCNLGDEEVILNLASGIYYGLNSVGSRIWQLVQAPITVDAVIDTVLSEYVVDRAQCDDAVPQFLAELVEFGLLEKLS